MWTETLISMATEGEPTLEGSWTHSDHDRNRSKDLTCSARDLVPHGAVEWIDGPGAAGAACMGDCSAWLTTGAPVLRTNQSFSVTAWIRLERAKLGGKLALEPGEHALTAVSQDSPTHSAFYLGVRAIETAGEGSPTTLRWNFTVSPRDGSETGVLEWQHAHSSEELGDDVLDRWVFLVGVCDLECGEARLLIPSTMDQGRATLPAGWTFWHADDGFVVGRGRWLGRNVDPWPGSVGAVQAYAGVLTMEDAKRLYREGCPAAQDGNRS